MKKKFSLLLTLITALFVISGFCFTACGNKDVRYTSLEQLNSEEVVFGVLTGSVFDALTKERFPKATIEYYETKDTMAERTIKNGISAFMLDEPVARSMEKNLTMITYIKEYIEPANYAFAFPKNESGAALKLQMDAFINEIETDGTLDELDALWFGDDEEKKTLDLSSIATGVNGTLTLSSNSGSQPFSYIKNGKMVGYDIDVAARFCKKYGYGLKIDDMTFSAIIPSLSKNDFAAACITVTEERAEQVYFSLPDYKGGIVVAVKGGADDQTGFIASIGESFDKNFIKENRWLLIVEGIGVTLLISVCSAVLGTILGFGVCLARRSKNKAAVAVSSAYIRILQGTPIVVLLMIFYYVIFGRADVSGLAVAVVAFALNFAAYVSEMMRTGIDAVDKGQIEAAYALGFTKNQTFLKVILPQAAKHFLPVFKGEFISLVKNTSVVGYIAVQDLTKMSDIIRSRTYEAFFPLIVIAILYFVISYLLSLLLKLIEFRVEPKRRKKLLKGVTLK